MSVRITLAINLEVPKAKNTIPSHLNIGPKCIRNFGTDHLFVKPLKGVVN